jgi:hypothetical protein
VASKFVAINALREITVPTMLESNFAFANKSVTIRNAASMRTASH